MTTQYSHPYNRLTIAEARLVDRDEVLTDGQAFSACSVVNALGLTIYGPGADGMGCMDFGKSKILSRLKLMRKAQTILKMGITPENINEPYTQLQSGDTQPLGGWYDDYLCMDAESWHGKEDEDCHPENWIEDGHLVARDDSTAA